MKLLPENLFPLNVLQKDIAIDQLMYPDIPFYNIGCWLKIEGKINYDIFKEAASKVIEENDCLHIVLRKSSPLPVQEFQRPEEFQYSFVDFSNKKDAEFHAHEYMNSEFIRPFALYDQSLYRYRLVKTSDQCCYFLTVHHHLIMDGLSHSLISFQTAQSYRHLLNRNKTDEDRQKRNSYQEFITKEVSFVKTEKFQKSLLFWKNEFKELPQRVIEQKHENPGSADSFRGSVVSFPLPLDKYIRWLTFSKTLNCTPYHMFIAALYIYFQRTNPTRDFVFGAPAKNRPGAIAKNTCGLYSNITPVKIGGEINQTSSNLLDLITKKLKSTYRYQSYPIGGINRLSGIQKSGYNQLFDIVVSYETFDFDVSFNGGDVELQTLNNGFVRSSLSLAIKKYHAKQGPQLELAFNQGAFTKTEVDELIERLIFIIDQILIQPDKTLGDFQLIPENEKNKILQFGNHTKMETTQNQVQNKTCYTLFENIVDNSPEATAAICNGLYYTYSQLNETANRLAHYLISLGIQTETIVGIHMDRSYDMLASILAVLKSGATYLPLDPSYPIERIDFMIEDSQTSVILTQVKYKERFEGHSEESKSHSNKTLIYLDDTKSPLPWADEKTENPSFQYADIASLEDPAYIIYTSGSTGKPKGVVNLHRGLSNLVSNQSKIFNIKPGSRILQFTSLSFDVSASDIFTTLCVGATLVLESAENILPGKPLAKTIQKYDVTHIALPPSSLVVMPPLIENSLPSLTTIITGGETPPLELFKKWSHGRDLFNAYGPTETTVCASIWLYDPLSKKANIGRPLQNVITYILDENMNIVPIGVSGELYISGAGLARGYLNREGLTQEKFILNPFYANEMEEIYSRMYKTGDKVRYLPDGNIEFLGRFDSQIKVRGYRIELEEIEATLRKFPMVDNAAVSLIGSGLQDKKIAAYVLASSESKTELDLFELKLFLKKKLPAYMVPTYLSELKEFPVTANGKIDKLNLPDPTDSVPEKKSKTGRKYTDTEKKLFTILKDTAAIEDIDVNENMFDAGLDSLNSITFLITVEKQFSVKTHNSLLIHLDTIELLAAYIEKEINSTTKRCIQNLNTAKDTVIKLNSLENNITSPMSLSESSESSVQNAGRPFFCVTAGYGDIIAMKALSQQIGSQCSFYVLQPPNSTDSNITIQFITSLYLAEIKKIAPVGPYLLGGYSAGGIIAFEMAQQLLKSGERVDHVVMLGAPLTHGQFSVWIRKILKVSLSKVIPKNSKPKFEILRILNSLFLDEGLQKHMDSLVGYVPEPYVGKLSIFEGRLATSRFFPWEKKWKKLASGGIDIWLLPGNHDTFIRPPGNKELAKHMKEIFEKSKT